MRITAFDDMEDLTVLKRFLTSLTTQPAVLDHKTGSRNELQWKVQDTAQRLKDTLGATARKKVLKPNIIQ